MSYEFISILNQQVNKKIMPEVYILGFIYALLAYRDLMAQMKPKIYNKGVNCILAWSILIAKQSLTIINDCLFTEMLAKNVLKCVFLAKNYDLLYYPHLKLIFKGI